MYLSKIPQSDYVNFKKTVSTDSYQQQYVLKAILVNVSEKLK